jgi:zinc protease
MKIDQVELKNKLNTLFIHSPGSTAASVQIWFRAGSALEKKDNQGIAHFLEHMFFKGTPTRPGPLLAQEIESYGGEVNAFTSFDYTCYYINTPAHQIEKSIDILLDMVSNPLFGEDEIPAERQVVFEEYRRAMDNPSQFNFIQIQKNAFEGGYSHPILGREDTITKFSRDQINEFRNKFYNIENALFVVAGDLSQRNLIEQKISQFKLPSGSKSKFEQFLLKSSDSVHVHEKEIRQATLTINISAPKYDDSKASAQDLAVNCLAHGETSRLYQALVAQNSICNGVAGSTMYFAQGGTHMIKVSFPIENIGKMTTLFSKTLEQVTSEGFHENEIEKIKNQYIASKIYERESIESYAFSLGHGFAQNGDIFCEEAFIEKIRSTTAHDVNLSLKEILTQNLHFNLQVPQGSNIKQSEIELKKLQLNLKKTGKKKNISKIKDEIELSKFDPSVKIVELKKGIKLIYRQNKLTPTFVFHAYLKGGQSAETSKSAGVHHLTSRLFNYGHEGTTYEKLKQNLETMSASLNGFSGKNAYGLTMHGQSKNFEKLMGHFFGTLIRPTFPKKFFLHEKKIILRALDNQKEDAMKQAFKAFYKLVFSNHPYSLDLAGTPETIKTFSPEKLKKLHLKNLKSSQIIFTYCGDLDFSTVVNELNDFISQLSGRTTVKKSFKTPKAVQDKKIHLNFKREQTQIVIGRSAYPISKPQELYLKMISAHLSGQGSELFVEVRDRLGLCYSVSPVHISALEAGCWAIYIGSGHDKTEAAIKAILNILNKLKSNGITRDEFNRIKSMIDGQNLLSIQTNEDYAQVYSVPVLHDLGLDFSHLNNKFIRDVKYEDFQKFIKSFFNTRWNIVQAGPKTL